MPKCWPIMARGKVIGSTEQRNAKNHLHDNAKHCWKWTGPCWLGKVKIGKKGGTSAVLAVSLIIGPKLCAPAVRLRCVSTLSYSPARTCLAASATHISVRVWRTEWMQHFVKLVWFESLVTHDTARKTTTTMNNISGSAYSQTLSAKYVRKIHFLLCIVSVCVLFWHFFFCGPLSGCWSSSHHLRLWLQRWFHSISELAICFLSFSHTPFVQIPATPATIGIIVL